MIKNAYVITFKTVSGKRTDSLRKKLEKNLKHKYNLWKIGTCTSLHNFCAPSIPPFSYTDMSKRTHTHRHTHTQFVVKSEQLQLNHKKSSL